MIINKTAKYTQIKPTQNSVSLFFEKFKNSYSDFTKDNIIIDFSEKINIKDKEILLFLKLSQHHKDNGTSFVIISNQVKIDNLPEEINVIPTHKEAIDIIEMEAIERDLGF